MRIIRRRMLTGLGGITMGLPWLAKLDGKAWAQSAPPARPKRVLTMTYAMGTPVGQWLPSATGATFTLPYVTAPLEKLKSRCLFVSGLDHKMLEQGGNAFAFGHPGKQEAALTGTLTAGAFPTNNANGVSEILAMPATTGGANAQSIETLIGRSLFAGHARPSVDLGVDGDQRFGMVKSGFCFEGRSAPVSMNCSPASAFASLFSNLPTGSQADAALAQLKLRRKSVLDAVRDSFSELKAGLGADDQRRLTEHAARIRQVELDMQAAAVCAAPAGITNPAAKASMDQIAPLQIRVMAQAMACNLAPVGRIEFVNQQSPRFGIPSLDSTLDAIKVTFDWHGMVHGDPLPGTTAFLRPGRSPSVTTYDQRLLDGYRFFVQQFADLLGALDAIPEGPGTTALDNSLVILATDFGDGLGHYHGKMGYIVAGNLGRAMRGYHHAAAKPADGIYGPSSHNVNQLLNSIADMAGVTDAGGAPIAEFGLQGFLKKVGAPRRIDALFTA
jgi:Protein of unknown function (DUF1552)